MSIVNCPWNIQTGSKISEYSVTVSEVVPSNCSHSFFFFSCWIVKHFADINYPHLPCGRMSEEMVMQGKVQNEMLCLAVRRYC